jgi:hypothetical protein
MALYVYMAGYASSGALDDEAGPPVDISGNCRDTVMDGH